MEVTFISKLSFLNQDTNGKYVLLLLPAFMAFLIILIPTLKFQWPLSWDIYYHVHLSKIYIEYGLTWWDPLTVAPYGRPIAYPPFFHLLIAGISYIFSADPFQVVRFMQPLLGASLVLSITYVTYKLFGLVSGISAGLLTIFSFITINRGFFASPATLSLILMPLVLYTFYRANQDRKIVYILISGILSGIIFLTHSFTALIVLMVIFLYFVAIKLLKRQIYTTYVVMFFILTGLIAVIWWGPLYILYSPHFNVFAGYPIPITEYYIRYLGVLPTILATIGGLYLLNKGENKGILILVWSLSALFLSRAYLIGLDIISIRVLEVASYPLIIMAGYGLAVSLNLIINKLRTYKSFKNVNIRPLKAAVLVILSLFTMVSGAVFADGYTPNLAENNDYQSDYIFPHSVHLFLNPLDYIFKFQVIADRFGDMGLAQNRMGVVEWFMKYGDKNSTVYSTDSYMDTIIVSTSRMHVIKGGYSESIPYSVFKRDMNNPYGLTQQEIVNDHIKYLVLRNGMEIPSYAREVYRNSNYIICTVE